MRRMIVGIVALGLVACGGDTEEGGDAEPAEAPATEETAEPTPAPIATSYAAELGIDLESMEQAESGLRYEVQEEGTGEVARLDDTVVVHYTGWLPDGTKFDSSRDRDEPFSFLLGAGRVIPGWDEGVAGMKVGGKRKLVIPPDLGYGARGAGNVIPPDATLVFDIELLEVR